MTTKTKQQEAIESEYGPLQSPLAWWDKAHSESATLARWMALYEAVNIIADKAEERGIPLEKIDFKPLDIRDYISSTENIILMKILEEDYKIKVCYEEPEDSKEYAL